MDGFTYTNIFDTKGIEYLIIISFFLVIIPFWIFLNKPLKLKKVLGILSEKLLRIPQGLFYSKNHTWTHLEKSGNAKVGLNDLLMHITGEVTISNLKGPGEKVSKGDIIARIIQDEKQLNISSPISGEIHSINESLSENLDALNEDPYGNGWIYMIKPEKWVSETNAYFLADDATEWAKKELARFKDFIAMSMEKLSPDSSIVILQEGGELSDNPLSGMSNEVWKDFQAQFLDQNLE
jgi:glycine cleavage system H protein